VLCEALQHNLPPFTPPGHMPGAQYPMPRVIFRMFDYTDAPEVRAPPPGFTRKRKRGVCRLLLNAVSLCAQGPVMPGSHSVERYVIEENLHCIIHTHWKERKTWCVPELRLRRVRPNALNASALLLLSFPFSAAQLLSYPGKNKIPLNYHIVEVRRYYLQVAC